ncbi:putative toxin-antitoxin system toxin component, PIN family [Leptospirillum ferrooxidans]|jgi:putative PIN family toxin of toxin-antitoxin system|uniref:Putative PilT domaincontaining protein n=1 Tax=Leptospirillum ferrooxidans (strain C2-3) TaxID=1162668 RepID=I0IP00_LEPFC|nr:putative toxin-antitoxin system toxin component, PIN family [Leptospirillum ferrooxidans]BAM06999.1 putative PilT domaincontaining protein [Leptospirillum ferrooxidans C2-3]
MKKVVLDTSVIVAAMRSASDAGSAHLRLVSLQRIRPLATIALFLEYEDVLKRPENRSVIGMSLDDIDKFLFALASACEPVDVHFRWRPQLKDTDDEMVLEAATNEHADALMTYNLADFQKATECFSLRVVLPGQFLKEISQ